MREKVQNHISINYKLLIFLLSFIPLYLFKNIYLKVLGNICIVMLFILIIFNDIYKMDRIKFNKTWLWFIVYMFYNTILLLRTPTLKALYSYLLQFALLLFITNLTMIYLNEEVIKKIFRWGKMIFFILLIPAGIIALEGGREAFLRFNYLFSPVIYKIMFPCSFFLIADSKCKFIKIVIITLIFLRMIERTMAIVLLSIYFMYKLLGKLGKSKILYKSIFVSVFILVIGFTYCYVQLQYTELGFKLNNLFRQYTGGNFFSGRNMIWEMVFEYIKEAPVLGYGLDNEILRLAGIELSAHNTYIHIFLQGGTLGLLIFFLFMYSIWKRFFNYLDNDIVATIAAYLIGILIFINFEVTLIGNSVVTAVFLWFILGIGLVECKNEKLKN